MIAGAIYMYAGSVAPTGFLMCDGSAVSRTTYANLYAAIGDLYGAGDGSTTFNLPDLSGRVVIGADSNHALASSGGEETHSLTSSEIPSHTHTVPSHTHTSSIKATTPKFVHTITQAAFNYNKASGSVGTTNTSGGRPQYSGAKTATGSRTTNVAISAHDAAACTMSGGVSDCAAFDTEPSGSGAAHENMQPYLTMSYIISTGD